MLYFSKIKIISIYLIIVILSFFTLLNLFDFKENFFFSKKVNLGLDLQGGSYLLLEVDTKPVEDQRLQYYLISLKKFLKDKKFTYENIKISDNKIFFRSTKKELDRFLDFFNDRNSIINNFYNKYNAFEMLHELKDNEIQIYYSRFGILEIKNSVLDQSLEIVRRRIDEVGTNDPTILKRGSNRILVELPGMNEPNRIKDLLGKTANLTFRFVSENENDNFGTELIEDEETKEMLTVSKRVIVSGENLLDAQPKFDNSNNLTIVSFSLDTPGAKRFARATTNNIGRKLAIVLDNKIISAPEIREPILAGAGQISGDFTFQTATDLALLLRSGALPAPLSIIEERTVGPDLGEDSIKSGAISLIVGFMLVIFFMLLKYKTMGVIANISLIINLFLLIGVLTMLEATLTLPGIAGIVLTVGMAVDANVLIFERIKEEFRTEKSIIHAFDAGYKKAQSAVLDANITTLLSAMILFFLGSGPVKGFAITLGIGILTTLFTAYFFARHLSSMYVMMNKDKKIVI